jgi:hypothetical protein
MMFTRLSLIGNGRVSKMKKRMAIYIDLFFRYLYRNNVRYGTNPVHQQQSET